MNKRFIHPATLFFLLTLAVALFSWVGSIYGWQETHSLLNTEGLRWILRNAVPNFLAVPWLGQIVILSFGVGICAHSGWGASTFKMLFRRQDLSKKQMHAWRVSLMAGIAWGALCLLAVFGPWNDLLSITGKWKDSPLADGLSCLCAIGFGLIGLIYGYAIDYYRNDSDIVGGVSYFFRCFPSALITLFCLSQFFCSFRYTGLYHCLHLSDVMLEWTYRVFVVLALAIVVVRDREFKKT